MYVSGSVRAHRYSTNFTQLLLPETHPRVIRNHQQHHPVVDKWWSHHQQLVFRRGMGSHHRLLWQKEVVSHRNWRNVLLFVSPRSSLT